MNPWPALWALVMGFFMILVDVSIVSIATPALMREFDAGVAEVLWVTSAYALAYAVPLLITGRLGDRYGPKRLYLVGLAAFTLSSLACGFSTSIGQLVAARVAQGLGASMMTPQTMAIITRTFPVDRRGTAMSLWGATAGAAFLVGPLLGGVLLDQAGWQWIFFINIPVGVLAFVAAWRLVPALPTHASGVDWVGVVLSAVGLFSVVFAIQEGGQYGWGTIVGPISVPLLIAVGVLMLAVFIWWQGRVQPEPLVPLSLFTDRNFSLSTLAVMVQGFAVNAMFFPLLVWLQTARDLSASQAALVIAPQAVFSIVLAPVVGRYIDRLHPRLLPGLGMLGFSATLLALAAVMTPDSSMGLVIVVTCFIGITSACIWGPLATTANRNLPMRLAGAGSGVYNLNRQVGSTLGAAAIAAVMAARLAAEVGPGASSVATGEGGEALAGASPGLAEGVSTALSQSMLLPAVVLLMGAAAALGLEQMKHRRS